MVYLKKEVLTMKHLRVITAILALFLLVGCAENPDSDIVNHKEMENLISEAQQDGEGKQGVEDLRQYDSYKADIANESLRVTIHADAKVDIPQTDKLSIFRVKQHDFTQSEVDNVRQLLLGDQTIYDGVAMTRETKADIERQIASTRAYLDEYIAKEPKEEWEKQDREVMIEELQKDLDRLQKEYEAAPFEAVKIISDGRLKNASEMLSKGEDTDYWKWQNDLSCKETIDVRNADNTAMLYVQNNPNYSNKISFRSSPVGTKKTLGVMVTTDPLSAQTVPGVADPFIAHNAELRDVRLEAIPGDSCELTREQAQEQAQDFIKKLSPVPFTCFEGGRYAEYLSVESSGHYYYRTCWILRYCREIGGVPLEQNSGMKIFDDWDGGSYRKQFWPGEMIELHISDSGIVELDWNAPLDITETVMDNAALEPFSDISGTFEKMMPMIAAPPEQAEIATEISIDRVTLSYSRISEKDSFDTGLIVPVWAFIGSRKWYDEPEYGVQMAVNAIDGSVIDSALGY